MSTAAPSELGAIRLDQRPIGVPLTVLCFVTWSDEHARIVAAKMITTTPKVFTTWPSRGSDASTAQSMLPHLAPPHRYSPSLAKTEPQRSAKIFQNTDIRPLLWNLG